MKFICERQKLNEAVTNVQRAVSSKSTMPALEGILIKAEQDHIDLCGYDLEIGITTSVNARVSEKGSIVINAKLFSDIIRKMPENEISIETNDKLMVYIVSGKVDYKIIGISADEYPELPSVTGSENIYIDGETLNSMIRQTKYAIADNDIKPAHKGSLFEIENGNIKVISVDGYRLAIRNEKINYDGEKSFIVPGKSLSEVTKLISEETKDVTITIGGRHIVFHIDDYS